MELLCFFVVFIFLCKDHNKHCVWTSKYSSAKPIFFLQFSQISPTEDRINIDKLKVKEKIYFYDDIILYEDELADNGCAKLNVKMVSLSLDNTKWLVLIHHQKQVKDRHKVTQQTSLFLIV